MRALVLLTVAGVGLIAAAVAWVHLVLEQAYVARERVERFAARQSLTVTTGNGAQVIRYLATTRRWRASGLMVGIALSVAWDLPHGRWQVNFLPAFAGWFVGALIAEGRVAHLALGARRAASLLPRRPSAYLPGGYWWLVPGAGIATLAATVAGAASRWWGRPVPAWPTVGWAVAGFAIAVTVRLIQRSVLRRPQPVAAPDVLAADDAIRSRSLHVLAGGGTTLLLYCAFGQLGALATTMPHPRPLNGLLNFGLFATPLFGWYVATRRWPTGGRPRPPAPVPAA